MLITDEDPAAGKSTSVASGLIVPADHACPSLTAQLPAAIDAAGSSASGLPPPALLVVIVELIAEATPPLVLPLMPAVLINILRLLLTLRACCH